MKDYDIKNQLSLFGTSLEEVMKRYDLKLSVDKGDGNKVRYKNDIYLCPLCKQKAFFRENDEFLITADFTKDHYPPESVGGKDYIYVCDRCNNQAGINFDYSLKEYLQYLRFSKQQDSARYPLKVSFDGIPGRYNIMAEWENGKLIKNIDFRKYPLIRDWLTNPDFKPGSEIHIETQRPGEQLLQKALLKAAYLCMFDVFGFEFAFSNTARKIADIILNNGKHPMSNNGVFQHDGFPKPGIYRILEPVELSAFMVNFTLVIDQPELKKSFGVIIPLFSASAWENLKSYNPYDGIELPTIFFLRVKGGFLKEKHFFAYSELSAI